MGCVQKGIWGSCAESRDVASLVRAGEVLVAMMGGPRSKQRQLFTEVPEPPDSSSRRLLCAIQGSIDWSPIRKMAAPHFSDKGRPSIDPVVMVKMMLVGYLFGIESDRSLVVECSDRLSLREFLGYEVCEALPTHASFTHWRQRLGSEFFRALLHEIVRQCVAHGVSLSRARTVDATSVKAQADKQGPVIEVPRDADMEAFLSAYFAGEVTPLPVRAENGGTVAINTHDPGARLQRKKGETAQFRYQASFCVDAETGFVTDATATAYEESATALDHVVHDPFPVEELAMDGRYDEGKTLSKLQGQGLRTYVPKGNRDKPQKLSKDLFLYDAKRSMYVCPMGAELGWYRFRWDKGLHYYIARISDCRGCPLRCGCTTAARRTVTRTASERGRERAVRSGHRYRQLARSRQINEHIHRLGKRDHGLGRARSLGLESMRIQSALTGMAIDIKKLMRWMGRAGKRAALACVPAPSEVLGALRRAPDRGRKLFGACLRVLRRSVGAQPPPLRLAPTPQS